MLKRSAGALSLAFTFYNSQDSSANFSLNIGPVNQVRWCAGTCVQTIDIKEDVGYI